MWLEFARRDLQQLTSAEKWKPQPRRWLAHTGRNPHAGRPRSGLPRAGERTVDIVIALRDPLFFTRRRTLTAAALASRLPTIYAFREPVDDGGLISYGIDISQNFRRAADYVVKILKGAKPGDLPVEFPTKLELVINLPTA